MTTIALKDGVLAVDSQWTVMDTFYEAPKLFYCEGLGAVAICGQITNAENIAKWLFRGANGLKPGQDWAAYYLTKNGDAFMVQSDSTIVKCADIEFDGCGGQIAHTAMHLGHNATYAVKTAIELCPHTGGPICTYDSRYDKVENACYIERDDLEPTETRLPNYNQED